MVKHQLNGARKHRRWLLALGLALGPAFNGQPVAAAEQPSLDATILRVITYNVQFLPEPVSSQNKRAHPDYRARRIAREVSRYDIVGLQETFHPKYRKLIVDQTRRAWNGTLRQVVSPTPPGFFTSGGLLLLTRLPLSDSSSMVFANYSRPADYGLRADGFAAKGVLHARIARCKDEPDNFIDVFVTHLEARADRLRPAQYQELANFVKKTSDPNRPMLLMGDLNTEGQSAFQNDPQSQYSDLLRRLNEARPNGGVVDLWTRLRGQARGGTTEQESEAIGKRIDYIFLGNPSAPHVQLTPLAIDVQLFQDSKVIALSDHNAVAAELEWPAP